MDGVFVLLIAPNPFKGTFSGQEVGHACMAAAAELGVPAKLVLGSDGGDGLVQALDFANLCESDRMTLSVRGPLSDSVSVPVVQLRAGPSVLESRLVCGLDRIPSEKRDPMRATTRGIGESLLALSEVGVTELFLGLGGSATVDGGMGMARALGWRFLDSGGKDVPENVQGMELVSSVVAGPALKLVVVGLADVTSPLVGDAGAIVFAQQKGASPTDVTHISRGFERLVEATQQFGSLDAAAAIGAGAAGGLGFAVLTFLNGSIRSGVDWMVERVDLNGELGRAHALLTGEGSFDHTSRLGKWPGRMLELAAGRGIPSGLLAPKAVGIPDGVMVETGDGIWGLDDVRLRAGRLIRRLMGT